MPIGSPKELDYRLASPLLLKRQDILKKHAFKIVLGPLAYYVPNPNSWDSYAKGSQTRSLSEWVLPETNPYSPPPPLGRQWKLATPDVNERENGHFCV
jgi:hypothetical protein